MKLRKSIFFSLLIITIFCLGPIVYGIETYSGKYPPEVLEETHGQKGWSETTQSRIRQSGEDRSLRVLVDNFIQAVRKGDEKAFLYVTYRVLEGYDWKEWDYTYAAGTNDWSKAIGVIPELERQALKSGRSFQDELTKGNDPAARTRVVKACLAGLFNKDPRCRLVAVNWLRRLTPDMSMQRDVKKALCIETVTTERAKWREHDLDIPNIENPRLGANDYMKENGEIVSERFDANGIPVRHWDNEGTPDMRNGWTDYKAGSWLMIGQFNGLQLDEFKSPYNGKLERNDYKFDFTYRVYKRQTNRKGESRLVRETIPVWTKFSLLRYGADEQTSGWEEEVKIQDTKYLWEPDLNSGDSGYCFECVEYKHPEEIEKFRYLYVGFPGQYSSSTTVISDLGEQKCPANVSSSSAYGGSDVVLAYHSIWEELKKLDLFITRDIWTNQVKKGNLNAFKIISKDTFRTLADQIDGESVRHVPMKSLDIFAEPEVKVIIVGLLENAVISTREECARHLKRIFYDPRTSVKTKIEIKKALKEARRKALLTDVIRGRHYHWELVPHLDPFNIYGEEDQIDTTVPDPFRDKKGNVNESAFKYERKYLELPEESIIIYHDRRKPGKVDEETTEEVSNDVVADDNDEEVASENELPGKAKAAAPKDEYTGLPGHEILKKENVSIADMIKFWERMTSDEREDASRLADLICGDTNNVPPAKDDIRKRKEVNQYDSTFYEFMNALVSVYVKAYKDNNKNPLSYMASGWVNQNISFDEVEGFVPKKPEVDKKKKKKGITYPGKIDPKDKKDPLYNKRDRIEYEGRDRSATGEWLTEFNEKKGIDYEYYYNQGRGGYWNYYDYDKVTDHDRVKPLKESLEEHPTYPYRRKDVRDKLLKFWLPLLRHNNPEVRMFAVHILRRMNPDKDMLKAVNSAIREFETVDKRRYYYIDTVHFFSDPAYEIEVSVLLGRKLQGSKWVGGTPVQETLYVAKKDLSKSDVKALDKVVTDGAKDVKKYEKTILKLIQKGLVAVRYPDKNTDKNLSRDVYGTLKIVTSGMKDVKGKKVPGWMIQSTVLKTYKRQEKVSQDELVKLQRFITRNELIKEIRKGRNLNLLKEVPKGHFLTLVVRLDAEWYERIPLQTYIPYDLDNTKFFRPQDIKIIASGLQNPNFIVQRETARWIVNYYNENVKPRKDSKLKSRNAVVGAKVDNKTIYRNKLINPDSDVAKEFMKAIRFAEAKDIVYYERNYKYKMKGKKGIDRTRLPNDRIAINLYSFVEEDLFWDIDKDRYKEQEEVEKVQKIYTNRRQRRQSKADEYYVRFP